MLITAGPTHEPIDRVRYLGNRSSGRLGIALAEAGAAAGWNTTLLLGPTPRTSSDPHVGIERFHSAADLASLLDRHFPRCDVLVMAAAVSDYLPRPDQAGLADSGGKIRRQSRGLTLHLEPTPDLLAGCSARRRAGQVIVGFALEPREHLLESARTKLAAKGLDVIVANPLESMDADDIEALVLCRDGTEHRTPGRVSKDVFSPWLLGMLARSRP